MSVHKRCACDEPRWPKCSHPWYLDQLRWQGVAHHPNLTRYAKLVLNEDLTTKTRAEEIAERVRAAIRSGTYQSAKQLAGQRPVVEAGQTIGALVPKFAAEVIESSPLVRATTKAVSRANLDAFAAWQPSPKRPPIGEWAIDAITTTDLVAFRNSPRVMTLANSTWAKYRTMLTQFFAWAKAEGHATTNPFEGARPDQARALRRRKSASRTQRISVADEARLLWAAGRTHHDVAAGRLQSLIIAAVETGMRRGELLALVWGDVDLGQRTIFVRAQEEGARKTGTARTVPISQRLLDELKGMRTDPADDRYGRAAYVFGDATGSKLTKIAKVWETAVLRAHQITPKWVKNGSLSPACRAHLRRINWHFHDLRHEAGCRWLESKAFDLEQIRQMYGHTTIAQTATYLHAAAQSARVAMQQFDAQRAAARSAQAAAALPKGAPTAPKLHPKSGDASERRGGPRLVQSSKLPGGV
jgi:integrase